MYIYLILVNKILAACDDDLEIKSSRYQPDEGSEFRFSTKEFDKPVEYCQVEQPNGNRLHFSSVPDKRNPNAIR